jgi:hypothetical protein
MATCTGPGVPHRRQDWKEGDRAFEGAVVEQEGGRAPLDQRIDTQDRIA